MRGYEARRAGLAKGSRPDAQLDADRSAQRVISKLRHGVSGGSWLELVSEQIQGFRRSIANINTPMRSESLTANPLSAGVSDNRKATIKGLRSAKQASAK